MGYIVQFLRVPRPVEGFQLQPLVDGGGGIVKNCNFTTAFGKRIVLCASSNDAQTYLLINSTRGYFIDDTTQICYTDSNDTGLFNSSNVNYVCLQRPVPDIFDTNTNTVRGQDPIVDGDQQPESNREAIVGVCGGYQTLLAAVDVKNMDTSATFSTVNGIQSTVMYIMNGLSNVSTTNCRSGTVVSAAKTGACDTVKRSIGHFGTLLSGDELRNISTTLYGSISNMDALLQTIQNTFKNAGCPVYT